MSDFEFGTACEVMRAEIVALIDGELGPAESDSVRSHLAVCAECEAFHEATVSVLQITRDAMPPATIAGFRIPEIDIPDAPVQPAESALLRTELQAARAEMRSMRAEMAEMRTLLTALRRRVADMPPRPVARPAFPYAAPMDRLRSDR